MPFNSSLAIRCPFSPRSLDHAKPQAPSQTLGSLDRRKGSAPTVLLVEDVKVSRRVAEASLKKAQYRVATAKDGEEAVEKYKQYHEDLEIVLMDINVSLHLCEVYVVITS